MTSILVTGGAGFIGSHLVDELLKGDNRVTVLDNLRNGSLKNLASAADHHHFRFIQGDILDLSVCREATHGCNVVYHLACLGVRHSIHSPLENHEVNATGTLNVLEAARNLKVNKFFYISSSEVYGKTDHFPISEKVLTNPVTVYGSGKLAGEHYTNSYHECYGLDTTVLRIFNNYGPRAHYEGDCGEVIPRSIMTILQGRPPVVFGDGEVTRDFFYVKDTAKVLASLLQYKDLSGETFNLGSGVEVTINKLLGTIMKLMNNHELQIKYLPGRPADVPRLWVDAGKLRSRIKINREMEFEDGLKVTIDYYQRLISSNRPLEKMPLINWEK